MKINEIMRALWQYGVWLWSSRNDFTASIPVYLQLTERGHLRRTPLEQLCTFWNSCCGI